MNRRRALLAGAALCALAFVGLGWIAAHGVLGAERSVQSFVQAERTPGLDRFVKLVTLLGWGGVSIPLSVVTVAALIQRHRDLAIFFAAVSAGGHLLSPIAKWVVSRPRPKMSDYGFPSGHTLAAVVVFGALMFVAATLVRRPVWRSVAVVICGVIIVAVASSRLYLNSHWTVDVAGGLTGGVAVLLFGVAWLEHRTRCRGPGRVSGELHAK